MATIETKTERELYEDWAAFIEGERDAAVTVDERLEAEANWIEQTNNSRGVDAEGAFPVERKVYSPRVQDAIDDAENW